MTKKKVNGLAVTFALGWMLLVAPYVVVSSGCRTTNQAAYKTTATVQVTADFAMRAWGEYVRIMRPPVADEIKVKRAFETYRASMIFVAEAGRRYSVVADQEASAKLDFALAAASASLVDLVTLIQSFGVKLQ